MEYSPWPLCDKCKESGVDYHFEQKNNEWISLCKDCYKEELRKDEPI